MDQLLLDRPLAPLAPAPLADAIRRACERVAPVWPLARFVAVNPYLGFRREPFGTAAAWMDRVLGVRITPACSLARDRLRDGRLTDSDLAAADRLVGPGAEPARNAIERDETPSPTLAATFADVLDEVGGTAMAALAAEQIGRWCAAYWDAGQAAWRLPWQTLPPYAAWRATARLDRTPELRGVAGFRAVIDAMPDSPEAAIAHALHTLDVPAAAADAYLHRALASVAGWAAYARLQEWEAALSGHTADVVREVLAIRLAWDAALFAAHSRPAARLAWREAIAGMAAPDEAPGLRTGLLVQEALDRAYQRELTRTLAAAPPPLSVPARPAVQVAFCIDVRSEPYRRALEAMSPEIETIGFAGFFGVAIEYVPLGHARGTAQCPVLLKPGFTVCEAVAGASAAENGAIAAARRLRLRLRKGWSAFKTSAVSCFPFVEAAGPLFGVKLLADGAGLTRTVAHPRADGLDAAIVERLGPSLAVEDRDGRRVGLAPEARIETAAGLLRAMSLTGGFARLVLLAGHGSTTVNNPHAASLDCGACGGHGGEANARVAAAILNDPDVRAGLRGRGIAIPEDTWFVPGLHDTTTDAVRLFDVALVPPTHRDDLSRLRGWLEAASASARMARAPSVGVSATADLAAALDWRGRDWAQVRPEWGLAGNAAFIAAPRARTRGLDLDGRVFLHSYDWRQDAGFGVLELILSAPVVVASWINLQYHGSTVDNRAFGSGNKVLHNVVGTIGVLEGNGGDLRTGLPLQSLHDGTRARHEPVRLSVLVEAPTDAIDAALARQPDVAELFANRWLHLFAITPAGAILRWRAAGAWEVEG